MDRELLTRPAQAADEIGFPPVPLALLDGALDRQFALACALVAQRSTHGALVTLFAEASPHPVPQFWAACNARAGQLCNQCGVEILLIEEGGQVRIQIERYAAPCSDPAPGSSGDPGGVPPWRSWLRRARAGRLARS